MPRRQSCMRTLLQLLVILALPLGVSQAQSDTPLNSNRYEWSAQLVTAGVQGRVIITKYKPKLHLTKSQRPVIHMIRLSADDDTDYYAELPDLQVGYRRPELIDQTADVHDDVPDEIKIRLVLARMRALEAYHQNWS